MGKQKSTSGNAARRNKTQMTTKKNMRKNLKALILTLVIGVLVILVLGGGILSSTKISPQSSPGEEGLNVVRECITHGELGMHIHPQLKISINGKEQEIPANIGVVSSVCLRPVHTHDASGKLHTEWEAVRDFTLGEFFKVWGKTFNTYQIFDQKVDETHTLIVTVNGVPNEEYENLILRDGDQIAIKYE